MGDHAARVFVEDRVWWEFLRIVLSELMNRAK